MWEKVEKISDYKRYWCLGLKVNKGEEFKSGEEHLLIQVSSNFPLLFYNFDPN